MIFFEAQKLLILSRSNLSIFVVACALPSDLRKHYPIQGHEVYSFFVFKEFYSFSSSIYVFDLFWVNIHIGCEMGVWLYSSVCGHPVSQYSLLKTYFFPIELSWHPCWKSVVYKFFYFNILNSFPLISMSVFMPVSHYLDYCSFVLGFEIGKCEWILVLFSFKIVAFLGLLNLHMNFRNSLWISAKKLGGNLLRIILNQFRDCFQLNNIISSSQCMWDIFPFI